MNARSALITLLFALLAVSAYAQNSPPPQPPGAAAPAPPSLPPPPPPRREGSVDLAALVQRVFAQLEREVVLDPRLPRDVYIGATALEDVTYPLLLAILRVYGLFAAEIDGRTFIMPNANARNIPTKLLQRDDPSVSDHEYVTRLIRVRGDGALRAAGADGDEPPSAAFVVPVLRVLIPVEGHLAAVGDHLIVVDRYDNVRRITAIVAELDR
jgi:type II secretory pathway component GspD/PulD (secretin)